MLELSSLEAWRIAISPKYRYKYYPSEVRGECSLVCVGDDAGIQPTESLGLLTDWWSHFRLSLD